METPVCLPFEAIARSRGEHAVPEVFARAWVTGTLQGLAAPVIAIVGTRAATPYGKRTAHAFALELGAAGCTVISGLALGIDAAAHEGALEAGARTIGVLGGGHEPFFPRRNRALAERIVAGAGAVLSPYPPGHPALPHQFLERNGIVAALSDAVIVIEAPERSGALNTAGWAAGRIPVFAVPGDIDRRHVAGCHALIRDGAILARSASDVLEDMRLPRAQKVPAASPRERRNEDPLASAILQALEDGELSLDSLLAHSNAAAAETLAVLSRLEIAGAIEARAGQRYALR